MKYIPKVKDRVSIIDCKRVVLGTVWKVLSEDKVYIKRDDGVTGGGSYCPGYGPTWVVTRSLNTLTKEHIWDYDMKPLHLSWKERVENG